MVGINGAERLQAIEDGTPVIKSCDLVFPEPDEEFDLDAVGVGQDDPLDPQCGRSFDDDDEEEDDVDFYDDEEDDLDDDLDEEFDDDLDDDLEDEEDEFDLEEDELEEDEDA